MFAAEHFVRSHHVWTCTACPVHDPRTGELLGVVDVSGPAETVHPTTVALVGTAVKLAEASLWRQHEGRLEALRGVAAPLLSGLSGPGLVVDDHGWVAAVTGMPSLERVAVPRAELPIAVHGVGVCVPEPMPGGWLLRASAAAALRLTLDLDARPPRAVVEGTSRWVHPLSTRHAEVLLLLATPGRPAWTRPRCRPRCTATASTSSPCGPRCRGSAGRWAACCWPGPTAWPRHRRRLPDLAASTFVGGSTAPGVRGLTGETRPREGGLRSHRRVRSDGAAAAIETRRRGNEGLAVTTVDDSPERGRRATRCNSCPAVMPG